MLTQQEEKPAEINAEETFSSWPTQRKVALLLGFLEYHGIDPSRVLVHGSLAVEIMGFNLVENDCGAKDIDLVCLGEGVFELLATAYPHRSASDKIQLTWGNVEFEIFREWAPAPQLAQHHHEVKKRACHFVVPTSMGDVTVPVANIFDIIVYKQARGAAPAEKIRRDRDHLGIMTGQQRDLLVSLMRAAADRVGKDTREMAVLIALGEDVEA